MQYLKHTVLLASVSVVVIIFSIILIDENRRFLRVHFLDVGQGDSILIEAPNGNQILIDAGRNKQVLGKLNEVIPFYDKSIDVFLETHPDLDHIGGAPFVLDSYRVKKYIKTNLKTDGDVQNILNEKILRGDLVVKEVEMGDRIILDYENDIYLDVLHPFEGFESDVTNDWSLVLRLVYKDIEFLLTGDATEVVEKILINQGAKIDSDILKVGHHGSKTSSSKNFLGLVSAKVGVISAGKNNSYKHPHPEVIDRLKEFDVEILETKELMTIVISSDGNQYWVED